MNKKKNILFVVLVVVCASLVFAGGCGGSTDAFARFWVGGEILPNSEVHAGKGSAQIAQQANKASLTRAAMEEGVIVTADDLSAIGW